MHGNTHSQQHFLCLKELIKPYSLDTDPYPYCLSSVKSLNVILRQPLKTHLQHNAPISERQWGFMSSRSTMSALIKVVDDCSQALDHGHEVCIVFFDVHKAFDTVPHLPFAADFG